MISQEIKEKLIEELAKTPFVSVACKRAGIGRATFYRWMEDDPDFREECEKAIDEGRSLIADMAESVIVRAIQKHEAWAVKYFLTHNEPRYNKKEIVYQERPKRRALLDDLRLRVAERQKKNKCL